MSKLTDEAIHVAAFKLMEEHQKQWPALRGLVPCGSELMPFAEKLARHIERLTIERCAGVCDAADKSTHPADLADALRALLGE